MDIFELREFCLSLPATEETTPFDETTLVYKVAGKMFLLTDMTDSRWINVKCDPDRAVELRETYEEVSPGWHMNKRHWNTVRTDGDLPAGLIREWIRDSYLLVVKSLPKTIRDEMTMSRRKASKSAGRLARASLMASRSCSLYGGCRSVPSHAP